MAPAEESAQLSARQSYYYSCPSGYYESGGNCYANSSWNYWGRWVFAGVVVVVVIIILFLLGCVNARRRRRRGLQPMYGTGWMGNKWGGGGYGNNPQAYGPGPGYGGGPGYGPPPPQYSRDAVPGQPTGNTFNSNEGYYGHQHEGIQLQEPANAYTANRGVDHGYEPPPGPPPSKIA